MIYIIGSGPAGISSALALIKKGLGVTIIDAGFNLENERAKIVNGFKTLNKKEWNAKSISTIKENMTPNVKGVDIKYVYGSDYPFRGINEYQPVKLTNCKMVRSLAKGGLSNVWGASVLPFRDKDIADWPITIEDLEPHYRTIFSFMKLSGKKDDLHKTLPLFSGKLQKFNLSSQTTSFLADMEKSKHTLRKQGFSFGFSRLAAQFISTKESPECAYCGLCLYGCPYQNIYSTCHTLKALLKNYKNFNYISGIIVEKLIENRSEIKIIAKRIDDSSMLEFKGEMVFLAAGLLSSTRILLQSFEAFNRTLLIKNSDLFQLPFLRLFKTKNITSEALHTLAQLFLELDNKDISKNTIHMQLYGYNDLYSGAMKNIFGNLAKILKLPINEILSRLIIIKGYIHSNISSQTLVNLEPGENGKLLLEGVTNIESEKVIKKIKNLLFKNSFSFKGAPIPTMGSINPPGTGNHSGGSFPMKKVPSEFEVDSFGRPYGFKKLHVVDSTIFPSIPATTITLTVMANAHRIATSF